MTLKTPVDESLADLKTALAEGSEATADELKAKIEDLNTKSQAMGQALYAAEQASGAADGASAPDASADGATASGDAASDDDVVDAEVVDDDERQGHQVTDRLRARRLPRASSPRGSAPTPDAPRVTPPVTSSGDGSAAAGARGAAGALATTRAAPAASSEPGGEDEFDHRRDGVRAATCIATARMRWPASDLADLQRLQAEYVNYKKRVDRDRDVIRDDGRRQRRRVAAAGARRHPHGPPGTVTSTGGPFAAIADKLESTLGTLRRRAARRSRARSSTPTVHEALMHVEAELPEGSRPARTVVQVLQPGYRIGERLVRAARVSVADAG